MLILRPYTYKKSLGREREASENLARSRRCEGMGLSKMKATGQLGRQGKPRILQSSFISASKYLSQNTCHLIWL